jgi:hypothetical protein
MSLLRRTRYAQLVSVIPGIPTRSTIISQDRTGLNTDGLIIRPAIRGVPNFAQGAQYPAKTR